MKNSHRCCLDCPLPHAVTPSYVVETNFARNMQSNKRRQQHAPLLPRNLPLATDLRNPFSLLLGLLPRNLQTKYTQRARACFNEFTTEAVVFYEQKVLGELLHQALRCPVPVEVLRLGAQSVRANVANGDCLGAVGGWRSATAIISLGTRLCRG